MQTVKPRILPAMVDGVFIRVYKALRFLSKAQEKHCVWGHSVIRPIGELDVRYLPCVAILAQTIFFRHYSVRSKFLNYSAKDNIGFYTADVFSRPILIIINVVSLFHPIIDLRVTSR